MYGLMWLCTCFSAARFFRVVSHFVAQFGSVQPSDHSSWSTLHDEPVRAKNTRGRISFAQTKAPNSRSTMLFINLGDNSVRPAVRHPARHCCCSPPLFTLHPEYTDIATGTHVVCVRCMRRPSTSKGSHLSGRWWARLGCRSWIASSVVITGPITNRSQYRAEYVAVSVGRSNAQTAHLSCSTAISLACAIP